jgi:hypothetical protein
MPGKETTRRLSAKTIEAEELAILLAIQLPGQLPIIVDLRYQLADGNAGFQGLPAGSSSWRTLPPP